MVSICFGKCDHEIKSAGGMVKGGGGRPLYEQGYKRCQTCSIFTLSVDRNCYCCGTRLRTRSRNGKFKKKTLATVVRY